MEQIAGNTYAIHSDNTQTLISATLSLLDDFAIILDKETKALREVDHAAVANLQDQKVAMGRAYHDAMMALGEKQDDLKAMDRSMKDRITAGYKKIQKSFDANMAALNAAREVAKRVQNIIVEAARKTVQDAPAYTSTGYGGISDDTPIHFRLNETL